MASPAGAKPGAATPRLAASERRERIVSSARKVFEDSGLAGTRTRDLAAAAGVTEALLYRHFTSKDELFEAAIVEPLERAVAELVAESGTPPEEFDSDANVMRARTYNFVLELLRIMVEIGPSLGVMLFGQSDRSAEYFHTRIKPTLTQIQDVIDSNRPAWMHRDFDTEQLVSSLFGMAWFLTVTDKFDGRQRDLETTAQSLTTMIIDGLSTPHAEDGSPK